MLPKKLIMSRFTGLPEQGFILTGSEWQAGDVYVGGVSIPDGTILD